MSEVEGYSYQPNPYLDGPPDASPYWYWDTTTNSWRMTNPNAAPLTPQQRNVEYNRELDRQIAASKQRTPYESFMGTDARDVYAQQDMARNGLEWVTSTPAPYLGPTVTIQPRTGTILRGSQTIGTTEDPSVVGAAGGLPGTKEIIAAHRQAGGPSIADITDYTGGEYPFPREKQGHFYIEGGSSRTPDEDRLSAKAAAGMASPGELYHLATLRSKRFAFDENGTQRAASIYMPAAIAAVTTAGLGAAGGGIYGALIAAGYNAFMQGAQTRWKDPWAIGLGAAGGFAGGYGGGAAANALGYPAGTAVNAAASGAGAGAGSATGRTIGSGNYNPADVAKAGAVGGATGAATGGASNVTGIPAPFIAPATNMAADTVLGSDDPNRRRRATRPRNPYSR